MAKTSNNLSGYGVAEPNQNSFKELCDFRLNLPNHKPVRVVVLGSLEKWIEQNSDVKIDRLVEKAAKAFIAVTGKSIYEREIAVRLSEKGQPNMAFYGVSRGVLDKDFTTIRLDIEQSAKAFKYKYGGKVVNANAR